MKKDIHPKYETIDVVMSDGSKFKVRSTMRPKNNVFHTEVDSKNHPFYTKNQKFHRKAGRIDRFNKQYGKNN